jgi:hypothetical protein
MLHAIRNPSPHFVSVVASRFIRTDNVRSRVNLLSAFTLTVGAAFGIRLPMALAIIWVCS